MFDRNSNDLQIFCHCSRLHPLNDNTKLIYRTVRLFNTAIERGRFARLKRFFTHETGCLLNLNEIPGLQMRARHYDGLRAVTLKKICGSLGRTSDFDCDFNPLDSRLRDRWQSIAMAFLHHRYLEPVDLIQVDDSYFVKDGHHRISVARALGQSAIDAEVTIWESPRTLPEVEQPVVFDFQSAQICS